MLTRTQPPLPKGLPPARPIDFRAFASGIRPRRRRTVDQWAECCSLSHPARSVVFKKCHQAGFSEVGLNLIGAVIVDEPAPVLVVLPTTDEVKKYVKTKLQPMIDATPTVAARVREQKSRDEDGSTTTFKKFVGGFLQITGANSSSGLKMVTGRIALLEEISEYPMDVDNQGDPVELVKKRLTTWEGYEKIVYISTPGQKGGVQDYGGL